MKDGIPNKVGRCFLKSLIVTFLSRSDLSINTLLSPNANKAVVQLRNNTGKSAPGPTLSLFHLNTP